MFKLSITFSFLLLLIASISAQNSPTTCSYNTGEYDFDLTPFANQSYDLFLQGSGTFYFNVCGANNYCSQGMGYEVSACLNPTSGALINVGEPQTSTFSLLNTENAFGVIVSSISSEKCTQGTGNMASNIFLLCKPGVPNVMAVAAQETNPCLYELFMIGAAACPK
ncbi:hypothetical protein CYY_001772 [Polysphondylium violaceum]|uniref:MRH domain-containing protein n=1 Tax=Polysphondylium violaceum TaxID=133409 RepID=A0A8J4VAA3_9MYCE|nr:hypothetical protein CYY_001772 [Polysphondylium violaceum]